MTNYELYELRLLEVARGAANNHQVFAVKARNAEVWDVEGNRYIDFMVGTGVLSV